MYKYGLKKEMIQIDFETSIQYNIYMVSYNKYILITWVTEFKFSSADLDGHFFKR